MAKSPSRLDAEIADALDPFVALDKRSRLALRHALETDDSASAPAVVVRKLERAGLVTRTGHVFEPQEWGKVVRREPVFVLTTKGRAAAHLVVDKLYGVGP